MSGASMNVNVVCPTCHGRGVVARIVAAVSLQTSPPTMGNGQALHECDACAGSGWLPMPGTRPGPEDAD